jgi:hypothetical protein
MVNVVWSQNDALMNLDKHGLNIHTIVQTWGTWDKSPYSSLYYTWWLWLDYIWMIFFFKTPKLESHNWQLVNLVILGIDKFHFEFAFHCKTQNWGSFLYHRTTWQMFLKSCIIKSKSLKTNCNQKMKGWSKSSSSYDSYTSVASLCCVKFNFAKNLIFDFYF